MQNISNPIYRVLIALVIIMVLIVTVVLVSPQPKGEVKVEPGSIGIVTQDTYLYEKGSSKSTALEKLPKGTRLILEGANGMMYKVEMENGEIAWVESEHVEVQKAGNK